MTYPDWLWPLVIALIALGAIRRFVRGVAKRSRAAASGEGGYALGTDTGPFWSDDAGQTSDGDCRSDGGDAGDGGHDGGSCHD